MRRTPELELMDNAEQALAYAEADFESAHQSFIDLFTLRFSQPDIGGEVLDLGCGPCDITRRFARAYPASILHAVDGATAMLKEARRLNSKFGMHAQIELIESNLANIQLPKSHYHTIISNSLLHHLHDPHILWKCIRHYASPHARIFIMDLMRPDNEARAHQLVNLYAHDEPDILKNDFYHSLLAAFTPEEVRHQLDSHQLSQLTVEATSDRHMIIYGML